MVDALDNARRVITPRGVIVDIHPLPEAPVIYLRTPGGRIAAGRLRGRRWHYRAADAAVAQMLARRRLRLLRSEICVIEHVADSLRHLREHVASDWRHAWLDEATIGRLTELTRGRRQSGGRALVIEERAGIAVFGRI